MGGKLQAMADSPLFWEVAFFVAIALLIFSHKISIEGMVSA